MTAAFGMAKSPIFNSFTRPMRMGSRRPSPASNGKEAALMIDTGAPFTLIDKNSIATFGLTVQGTNSHVGAVFGRSGENYEASVAKTIALGNCTVTNVPVALADVMRAGMKRWFPERRSSFAAANPSCVRKVASELLFLRVRRARQKYGKKKTGKFSHARGSITRRLCQTS